MSEVKQESRRAGSTERLFAGVFLTIVGLLGFGGGFGTMELGGFGHGYRMMCGWGCGYSPFFSGFNILFSLVGLVFLGVALFGVYLIYDAVRK
jgi:hypothetical protein